MSISIRNRLPGTIEKIVSDKVVSEIVIRTAAGTVTSIITTGSVKQMGVISDFRADVKVDGRIRVDGRGLLLWLEERHLLGT